MLLPAILLSMFFARTVTQQPEPTVRELLSELSQPETTESAEKRLYSLAQQDKAAYESIDESLPQSLLNPKNELLVVQQEALLAGQLRLGGCAPSLVKLLESPNFLYVPMTNGRWFELVNDPVGRALFEIADPRTIELAAPLLESQAFWVAPGSGMREYWLRMRVMRLFLRIGSPESRARLAEHLRTEDDPGLRRFLIANHIGKQTDTVR